MEEQARVLVYTTRICPYCHAAKRLLTGHGVAFEEVDLGRDPERRMELAEQTGWRTVPMIFLDGELVGGYQELAAMASAGGLDGLGQTDSDSI